MLIDALFSLQNISNTHLNMPSNSFEPLIDAELYRAYYELERTWYVQLCIAVTRENQRQSCNTRMVKSYNKQGRQSWVDWEVATPDFGQRGRGGQQGGSSTDREILLYLIMYWK